jgi:hypothetical protein
MQWPNFRFEALSFLSVWGVVTFATLCFRFCRMNSERSCEWTTCAGESFTLRSAAPHSHCTSQRQHSNTVALQHYRIATNVLQLSNVFICPRRDFVTGQQTADDTAQLMRVFCQIGARGLDLHEFTACDAFACVGGNTLAFARANFSVFALEVKARASLKSNHRCHGLYLIPSLYPAPDRRKQGFNAASQR